MATMKFIKRKEKRDEKRPVGRPRKERQPLHNLTVYLTAEERAKIEAKREEIGINSSSAMMRMILKKEGII